MLRSILLALAAAASVAADGGVFNYDATLRKVLPLQLSAAQKKQMLED